ncbi:hypothetical protein GBAR_LOCUS30773 [Geodia barretti]|uniref:Uncharacterized protein n=1 Tax=Geodia barretti TaxID=519541 RepID=A0AA35XKT9_GEOBA|nr:hypothetical protein GBAR_LOCUS30773 [Geodia barretti]
MHTVDVGVALFGPFQFPEGLRPVSPVFWVCVRDNPNFRFSKPVTVTIPHFLNLENDDEIQSLGLTFLKAGHNKNAEGLYEFQPTEGEINFQPFQTFGILQNSHFCSLCITCRDNPEVFFKYAYFFITLYNLSTCLTKVDELIAEKKLEHYKKTQVKCKFKKFLTKPALEIVTTQPTHGNIGVEGKTKIFRSEVDHFTKKKTPEKELQAQEQRDLYPPRFQIFLVSSPNDLSLSGSRIRLKGADCELQYDICLDLPDDTNHSLTAPLAIGSTGISFTHTETPGGPTLPELLRLKFPEKVGGAAYAFGVSSSEGLTGP